MAVCIPRAIVCTSSLGRVSVSAGQATSLSTSLETPVSDTLAQQIPCCQHAVPGAESHTGLLPWSEALGSFEACASRERSAKIL